MNPVEKRFQKTIRFLELHVKKNEKILDLGIPSVLSNRIEKIGFQISNTKGEDLDIYYNEVLKTEYDVVSAFEILEHLVAPFNVLKNIKADKLIVTVPLRLWFAKAYKNEQDPWDRHFHEFEDWQFDWLLEKAGWTIKAKEKWTSPVKKIGFRPILRYFTPRYYAIYAERTK